MISANSGPFSIELVETGDETTLRFRSRLPGRPFGSFSVASDGLSVHFKGHQATEASAMIASVAWQLAGAAEAEDA